MKGEAMRLTFSSTPYLTFIAILFLTTPSWANNPDLNIKGAVTAGYDDNIHYSEDDEESDFITQLTLGLEYLLEHKTELFSIGAEVHQNLYAENSDLNYSSQNMDLLFKKELSKYDRFTLTDAFEHSEDIQTFEEEFIRSSGRFQTYKNVFGIEYTKDLSPDNDMTIGYENEVREVERSDLHDSLINRINFEFDHRWSPKTAAFIKYSFSHIYVDTPDNAFIQTIAPGIKYFLTRQLLFTTYAGANIIHTFNDDNLVRPTFYASLTQELDKRSSFTLAYQKEYIPTGYSADILDQWRVSLQYDHQLSERLKGSLNAFYGEGEFDLRNIIDKLSGVSASLRYSLSDNWEATLSARHTNKESDDVTREYKKNTIFFGFIFKF
jgi:hypothetical protein